MTKSVIKTVKTETYKLFVEKVGKLSGEIIKAAPQLVKEAKELADIIADAEGNDQARDFIMATKFAFLYDEIGAKGKPKMSQKMRDIKKGLKWITENETLFLTWAESPEAAKANKVDLNNIKAKATPKAEKKKETPPNNRGNGEGEGEGNTENGLNTTPQKIGVDMVFDIITKNLTFKELNELRNLLDDHAKAELKKQAA